MKTNFFMLLCTFFMFIGNGYSTGVEVDFHVHIWKNSVTPANDLGSFTGSTEHTPPYAVTANNLGQLCPGDKLIIKNFIRKDGVNHSFDGTGSFGKATIGLSSSTGYTVPLDVFADVCDGACNAGVDVEHFPDWNWGSTITVTIPPHSSTTPYLVISTSITGNTTPPLGCGLRWLHIPMGLAPTTEIDDQTICSGDIVSLPLDPAFNYHWDIDNPNPNGSTLDATKYYTINVTHIATGCTQTENFIIKVSQPDKELFAEDEALCYDDAGIVLTENWFDNLLVMHTDPQKLVINGVTIADKTSSPNLMNFPHTINGATYGAGPVTIEYTYHDYDMDIICTRIYTITIHNELHTDLEDSYAFCDGNFGLICANSGGLGTYGISYKWTKVGDLFVHSTSHCFTPNSYGTYCLTLTDQFGCRKKKCFTVYNPGLGIQHLANITFCSLTQSNPRRIGWLSDPFGGTVAATYSWVYTNDAGTGISIITRSATPYNVPYYGTGTYTVVVTSGGCTETFTIIVSDLLHIYENHSNAAFSFTPLFGNMVSCIPNLSMSGITDIWVVEDQFGNIIPTIPHSSGIRFSYTTGVSYSVKLRREARNQWCQVFTNEFTWSDHHRANAGSGSNNSRNAKPNQTSESTAIIGSIQAFPNPTTGLTQINLNKLSKSTTSILVLNSVGKIVLQKEIQNTTVVELDLSNYASGIYMVKVINGKDEFVKKIIKQ